MWWQDLSFRRLRCVHLVGVLILLLVAVAYLLTSGGQQDFEHYPSISSIRHESMKNFDLKANGEPRIMNYTAEQLKLEYPQTWLRTKTKMGTIPIFVHGSHDLISKQLMNPLWHSWEGDRLAVLREKLHSDKELHLLDIGCNLGVFTLTAAAMGRKVVAVDANLENLKKLRKSVLRNNFQDRVTLIYNGIDEKRRLIKLHINPTNIGGSSVGLVGDRKDPYDTVVRVPTIKMDDLLKVIEMKKIVIKMDIENYEYYALKGAGELFRKLDVRALFMEWWQAMRYPSFAKGIIRFMEGNGFSPCEDTQGNKKITTKNYKAWPGDLNWIKTRP